MGVLTTEREKIEPFLQDPNYIKPKNLGAVRRYVCSVWDASSLLVDSEATRRMLHTQNVAFEDQGYFEDQAVAGEENFEQQNEEKTRALVLYLRDQRVPDFVTEDAIASASWIDPIRRTPFVPRVNRLNAIRDHIEAIGEKIPR